MKPETLLAWVAVASDPETPAEAREVAFGQILGQVEGLLDDVSALQAQTQSLTERLEECQGDRSRYQEQAEIARQRIDDLKSALDECRKVEATLEEDAHRLATQLERHIRHHPAARVLNGSHVVPDHLEDAVKALGKHHGLSIFANDWRDVLDKLDRSVG